MMSSDEPDALSYSDAFLRNILREVKTIAIVGASDKPTRPSFGVFAFLLAHGYRVIGVNPGLAGKSVHGAPFVKSLADIPEPIDMVDIFRNSEAASAVIDEALALEPQPKAIWMQLGVRNDAAAARAQAKGVRVVMDHCPKIEYERLLAGSVGPRKTEGQPKQRSPRRKTPPAAPKGAGP
jgi:predicted CoA-binding protein